MTRVYIFGNFCVLDVCFIYLGHNYIKKWCPHVACLECVNAFSRISGKMRLIKILEGNNGYTKKLEVQPKYFQFPKVRPAFILLILVPHSWHNHTIEKIPKFLGDRKQMLIYKSMSLKRQQGQIL